MSKQINVNPDFYKVGGREHSEGHGEAIPHERHKQEMARHAGTPGSEKARQIERARAHSKKK
jgi:hypothetical protein